MKTHDGSFRGTEWWWICSKDTDRRCTAGLSTSQGKNDLIKYQVAKILMYIVYQYKENSLHEVIMNELYDVQ